MARITSERAVEAIGNRYDLVLVASQRARELANGSRPRVDDIKHSNTVIALKEIEQGKYTYKDYVSRLPKKIKGQKDEYFTS
jgi:DNA-directed RNA polymerase subunit omega